MLIRSGVSRLTNNNKKGFAMAEIRHFHRTWQRALCALLTVFFTHWCQAASGSPSEVLGDFAHAVAGKNRNAFLQLFLTGREPWWSVTGDDELARIRSRKPAAKKLNAHNIVEFIDWVRGLEGETRVDFRNIAISGDENIASVICDYAFYLDGRQTNFGKEVFTMVKTENGWKITAIAFSAYQPQD